MSQHYPWLKLIELTGGFPRIVGREKATVYTDVDVIGWLELADGKKDTFMSVNHALQTGVPVLLSKEYGVEDCDVDRARDLEKTQFWVCAVWDGDVYHVVLKGTGDGIYVPMPGTYNIRSGRENRLILNLSELGI